MIEHMDVLAFDRDNALEETAAAAGISRSDLLRIATIGSGAALGGGALLGALAGPAGAAVKPGPSDVAILNYALTLEYLEAAFYAEAESQVFLKGRLKAYVRTVGRDEAQHRAFLTKVLGTQAVKRPVFRFGANTTTTKAFVNTAISLEDIGVSAYAGQGPRIKSKQILAAALSIHSVEARHAAWIRTLADKPGRQGAPAPAAFDTSRTMTQVNDFVAGTNFIV